jgi:hypothetical protein
MIADTIMVIMPLTDGVRRGGTGTPRTLRPVGADFGYQVWGKATGGLADSGFAAALGIPTLCGVGLVGGKSSPRRRMVPHRRRGSDFFLAIFPVRQGMAGAPVLRGAREEVLT